MPCCSFVAYHRVRRGRSSAASSSDRSGLDDETLLLIQDAHLMIERDDLILAEKIGQGMTKKQHN